MRVLRNSPFVVFAVKDYFLLGFYSCISLGSIGLFFTFSCLEFYIFQCRGLLWPLMIADKVFSIALGPIFGEKTS